MPGTIHAFDYLRASQKHALSAVCVLFGDEPFLKRLARREIRRAVLEDEDAPYGLLEGDAIEWRDAMDELATRSLFGAGPRLVVIQDADRFVTRHRARLEHYLDRPKTSGVLVLEVVVWQGNTRLYQLVHRRGLQIECRAPQKAIGKRKVLDEGALKRWLIAWSATRHDAKLASSAAGMLLELVGPEFGLLDQELAKLALFAGPGGKITLEMVRDVVGGWQAKTIWDLLDAALSGEAAEALAQLDRLLQAGTAAAGLFGQISWSLRRFAAATRIFERAERQGRRIPLRRALEQAGFRDWPRGAIEKAERQLRQLGRERAGQFYRWLFEADLAMKSTHSTPDRARFVLEQLLVRMAKALGKKPAVR